MEETEPELSFGPSTHHLRLFTLQVHRLQRNISEYFWSSAYTINQVCFVDNDHPGQKDSVHERAVNSF